MPDSHTPGQRPTVAAAVIVRGGAVLLIRRRVSEGSLSWQFPAGAVEDGESAAQAAAREAEEETGLRVARTAILGQRIHPDTGRAMVYVACHVVSGTAVIGDPEESRPSPTRWWRRRASGRTARWTRCTRWCSSTRSTPMIRDGQVTNRPIYVALAVTCEGAREVLGLWAGEHGDGEGAKYWLKVLTEIKNRGVADVCMIVCDGLKHLPAAVAQVWPQTIVQACIVHLLRNSFGYASRKDWAALAAALKPIYTASSEADALERFVTFGDSDLGRKYPAIVRLWENAWAEFVPFLAFDREIRTVICTTNAIESLNSRYRRAVNARGHFPTEQAALKCLYLTTMSLDPTGRARQRWTNRWKAALNAFEITFDGRLSAGRN